jgi:hypothetical protein
MVIVVSVIVLGALVAIVWVVVDVTRKLLRWGAHDTASHQRDREATRHDAPVIPFGGLPPLGPVGPLGGLSPDADIASAGTDEQDLYGN